VYLRVKFPEKRGLFGSGERYTLLVDADDADTTGAVEGVEPGADLKVEFNPPAEARAEGQERRGERLRISPVFAGGTASGGDGRVSQAELAVLTAPNHAAAEFEIRLSRAASLGDDLPQAGLMSSGRARVAWVRTDEKTGATVGEVVRCEVTLPARADFRATATLPAKAAGTVRLVAYNVLWSSPTKSEPGPAGFARIFKALDADVVLLQEWHDREADRGKDNAQREAGVRAWFEQHAGGTWTVVGSEGQGVFVASRLPVLERGPQRLEAAENASPWNFPVRLAAAVFKAESGPLAVGSVHLKCCGTYQAPEDVRRTQEAGLISTAMAELARKAGAGVPVVIGGDYNLVGDPEVALRMTSGLDADGSGLNLARPLLLGDAIVHTHGGDTRNGSRSRLDYFAYPDAVWETVQQFVLDTTILDAASLKAMGLEAKDTAGSDHLPVVVDLRPRGK
jgi:endonuclease/exonuclease/phosphatase family metal-dependent hydrolase